MRPGRGYKPLFPRELTDRILRPAVTLPPSAPPAPPALTLPAVPAIADGHRRAVTGAGALPPTAPAAPVYAASGELNVIPNRLYDVARVRAAVLAHVRGRATDQVSEFLFQRNGAQQSMAHWAAVNGQTEVFSALAEPLAQDGIPKAMKEQFRRILLMPESVSGRNTPAHVAGLHGRLDILSLYADERFHLSDALLSRDSEGNTPAHLWGIGGRNVEALHRLADDMRAGPGHPLRVSLTARNAAGLSPAHMGVQGLRAPDVRAAGAGAGAGAAAAAAGPSL